MNKTISAYDVLLADPFKGWNQFDLIDLNNLDIVTEVLDELGFNINKGIYIYPAQHRTFANEIKVGYIFCGEIAPGRQHVHGKYSSIHDMFASAELRDNGFYDELMAMSTRSPSYGADNALDDKIPIPEWESAEQREEEKTICQQIKQLADILYIARGDQRKLDGSVKSVYDYKNPETPPKKRKKKSKLIKEDVNA